uniref:Uncharacterized protein n=1 Tax=Oryza glumipatula TaxID=40148 RepID=A0A0D9ZI85_9ORYZ
MERNNNKMVLIDDDKGVSQEIACALCSLNYSDKNYFAQEFKTEFIMHQYRTGTNEATGTYAQACLTVAKELNHPVIDIWTKMQQFPDWQTSALWYGSISSDLIPKLDVWMGLITVKGCHLCYQ